MGGHASLGVLQLVVLRAQVLGELLLTSQSALKLRFALPHVAHRSVARAHDVADFVAGDDAFGDHLRFALAVLHRLVGV